MGVGLVQSAIGYSGTSQLRPPTSQLRPHIGSVLCISETTTCRFGISWDYVYAGLVFLGTCGSGINSDVIV